MIHVVKTIDAHAAGEPLRLVTDGMPTPSGRTMLEKRDWLRRRADHLRRALMLEPRGHADMYGAVRQALERLGHRVLDGRGAMGGYQAVFIDPRTGVLMGGSDPRKDGHAAGF